MAIESYEQIMARLNGQQAQAPTAATDFSTYVQNLLLNTNPQGGMMSDAEAYRADPFRRQNAINASLDEALKKKQAEEAAKVAAARGGMGMMGGGSGGDSGTPTELTEDQKAFFDWMENTPEGQAFKDQRGQQLNNLFGLMSPMAGMNIMQNGMPDFNLGTLFGIPQAARNWQEQQRQQSPQYIADAIKAVNRESVINQQKKFEAENAAALANSGWSSDGSSYTSSYGTTTDSGSISSAAAAGLDAARESYGYGSNADYYGD
jgi:hypothetical protein